MIEEAGREPIKVNFRGSLFSAAVLKDRILPG
jgi:hypothetical protein